MKKFLVLGCFLMSFIGLFGQNNSSKENKDCVIQGILDGVYKGKKVYLLEEEEINGSSKVIDSCDVKDNRYTFVIKNAVVPRMYFVQSGESELFESDHPCMGGTRKCTGSSKF